MESKKVLVGLLVVIIFGLFLAWWTRTNQALKLIKEERILLDTYVSIVAYDSNEEKANEAIDEAFKTMAKIDNSLNRYDRKSEVSLINKNAGIKSTKVSSDTLRVILLSKKYNQITKGAFDITIGPLVSLWDFNKRKVPAQEIIEEKLLLLGSNKILINEKKQTIKLLKKGMILDLGGVAKGYAADKAAVVLKKYGIKKALINTGSTSILIDEKPEGKFKIGIQHPRKSNEIIGILKVKDKSISTSGDYQQYFVKSGRRYNHIINPKTGRPATSVMSVTVITSKSCAEADILSTAIFVMGYPKGMQFINSLKDTEGVIVSSNRKIYKSRKAADFLEDLARKI